ncbi:hypothetical protein KY315_00995 [Candidatus Woesearchaeota archaeon]|nr:hypothetical protein [Candidatus Woesearchaeota archaeon]
MSIYLSESELRNLLASSILEGLFKDSRRSGEGSIDSLSVDKNNANIQANFKYESVPNTKAANNAISELNFWSGKEETDDSVKEKLKSYWENLRGVWNKSAEDSIRDRVPWSAAFISYVSEDPFFKSSAHIAWKEKAEKNTKMINQDPEKFIGKTMYVLLSNDENVKIERGDNVWKDRGGSGKSHSDIVISDNEAIGGNLSDSVKKTTIDHPYVIKRVKITGTA